MIVSKTPLRVSLFGGGTDFPEYFNRKKAFVIGGTINKYIYISVNKFYSRLFDHKIRLFYKKTEFVKNNNFIKHLVINKIFKKYKIFKDIELHIASDLPSNSGLGSSSAFTCGLLNLVNFLKKKNIQKKKLALLTIEFERKFLKESVGFQDQIFSAFGGFNRINFFRNKFTVNKYKNSKIINKLQKNLCLIHTGILRRADDIEKKKIKKILINNNNLDKLNLIAEKAHKIIKHNKNLDLIGYLLNDTWTIKKKLDKNVSNKKIDLLYNKALKAGAIGGKLLGAGGGGFMLFYIPDKNKKLFFSKFKQRTIFFDFVNKGSLIKNLL